MSRVPRPDDFGVNYTNRAYRPPFNGNPQAQPNPTDPVTPSNVSPSDAVASRQGVDRATQRQADIEKRELMLDLGQMALDVVGIVDPTPISDGVNGITSLFRGDLFGAGISALGMLPYVGDLAKVGKLGKYVRTMERIVSLAKTDARFAEMARPMIEQMRTALNAVPLDSLPDAARRPLQQLKGSIDEFFAAPPTTATRASENYTGTLRGMPVELPGVSARQVNYTKRASADLAQLRRTFDNSVRAAFVKNLAGDPAKVAQLRQAGLTDDQIRILADGRLPDGWQVHHKLPIDDGGTNDFSNLVLIKNEPYHKVITNAQNAGTRGMMPGETRVVELPIPEGFVYPPRP